MTRYPPLSTHEIGNPLGGMVDLTLQCRPLHVQTFHVQVFRALMYHQIPLQSSRVLREKQYKSRRFGDWVVALGCHHGGFQGGSLGERKTSPAQRMET